MTEPNDVQAMEKISAAVGQSQTNITLSNTCMKAQAFLVNRLRKHLQRQKEMADSISNDNVKLAAEIANAEQEINSYMQAHESVKSSNVELMKELQLAKERTKETAERVRSGIQKYDNLWEESKRRFESLGFVQEFLQATKKKEALQEVATARKKEIETLRKELKIKKERKAESTRKEIIELAEYMVHGKPKIEEQISVQLKEIQVLNGQIEEITKNRKEQNIQKKDKEDRVQADLGAPTKKLRKMVIDDDTLMPKLQLMNIDLDVMSVKLGLIKKSDLVTYSPVKDVTSEHKKIDTGVTPDIGASVSLYFQNPKNISNTAELNEERDAPNYSNRKLINILDDIKLDKSDTYNIVSKVDVKSLQGVSEITANFNKHEETPKESTTVEQDKNQAQDEEIEEIDLTSSNIIMPPSGFLDQLRSSQEKRKKVSFDMPSAVQESSDTKNLSTQKDDDNENEANATTDICPMDVSAGSEESFKRIKDMILKKHNLDLSPPFVYGKNTATPHVLQKQDEVVKSNYFKLSCEELPTISGVPMDTAEPNNEEDEEIDCDEPAPTNHDNEAGNDVEIEVCDNVISSAKENQEHLRKPVAGLLFSHGAAGIPDSLDVSMSTNGFEDGDADYPQYSSLLLSPKADLPMPSTSEKSYVVSQDVPNFLSGLRKSGFSFFGNTASLNTDEENTTSAPSGSNAFNFAFGGDNKQKRGGLFNMFN